MADVTIDFDELWAARGEPPSVKVFGETIALPHSIPVKVAILRNELGPDAPLTVDVVVELLKPFFGDRVERWIVEQRLERDQLIALYDMLGDVYADRSSDDDEAAAETEPAAS
jgi:hypothetical protein